jgi:YggT family protein
VTGLLSVLATLQAFLRVALLWTALAVAAVAATDWLVRTRRVAPFSPVARFFRRYVDPVVAPVERRVVRAGGLPASAPWWALAAVIIAGILFIALLDFLMALLASLAVGLSSGASGLAGLVITWGLGILQLAILVRVVVSWLPVSPFSPWVRWSFTLSEPILRPLRRFIPMLGSIDITPIVAFFLVSIAQSILLGLVR